MAKYVKNTTGGDKTWAGQLVSAGAYYQLQNDEPTTWAQNAAFITDVGTGDAVVAAANDGTADLPISQAFDFLRDELAPRQVTDAGVKEPNNYRARMKGMVTGTIPFGTTVDFDYKMEQLAWQGTNKNSYFDGVQYYAKDAAIGDYVMFQVVDKDGLVYPAGTVMEQFGDTWYVGPDALEDLRLFKSSIAPNFYIRVKYTSVGTTNVEFMCNLFRFIKTDEEA